MYMTFFAGSPCEKTVSFPRNLSTVLRRPAESRNNCASKAVLPEFNFWGERGTLTDTRRAAEETMGQTSMKADSADCAILHNPYRPALSPHLCQTHKPHRPIERGAVTVPYGTAFLSGCRTS